MPHSLVGDLISIFMVQKQLESEEYDRVKNSGRF